MINIAICDDEPLFIEQYLRILAEIEKTLGSALQLQTYTRGSELVADILDKQKNYDLLLLDIMLGHENGITLAKQLRAAGFQQPIVFLTNSREYALEGYELRAFNYVMKDAADLALKIKAAITHCEQETKKYLLIQKKTELEKVALNDIVFIESNRRKIEIHTANAYYEMYEKLDQITEQLAPFGFIRTHRSYLVNRKYIQKITAKEVFLLTGGSVLISRGNAEAVKRQFLAQFQQ
ncbi:MAG: LytR/AlgR family response regulator transcription factor [Culicoidibacterales bacterium]